MLDYFEHAYMDVYLHACKLLFIAPPGGKGGGHTMIQSSATLPILDTSEICISKGTLEQKRN